MSLTPEQVADRFEALRDEVSYLRSETHPTTADQVELFEFLKDIERMFRVDTSLASYLRAARAE
jgi:hypothetical protein